MEKGNWYHYTESGLDNVFLAIGAGVQIKDLPSGRQINIKAIDQLHEVIGISLAKEKKNLSGKEIRFLRQEMLLSQGNLAKLLGVTEQTVHRWETGKADVPKPAESLIRSLYLDQLKIDENGKDKISVRKTLERLADLEDEVDVLQMKIANKNWHLHKLAA
jgi:putative transcriptional regulator